MTAASSIGRSGLNSSPSPPIPKPLALLALAAFLSVLLCAAARGAAGAADSADSARIETCREMIEEAKRAVRAAAWSTVVSAEEAAALAAARDRMAAARSSQRRWPGLAAAEESAQAAKEKATRLKADVVDAEERWKGAGSPDSGGTHERLGNARGRLEHAESLVEAKIAAVQVILDDWSASGAGREYVKAQRALTAAEEAARGIDGELDDGADALIEEIKVRAALAPVESAIDGLAEAVGCPPGE